MPEGPEIRRTADRLAALLEGCRPREVEVAPGVLEGEASRLRGRGIVGVSARGKALLTRFEGGLVLYTHNQLYGRWEIHPPGPLPPSSRTLRLAIRCEEGTAALYSATEIELLEEDRLAGHPYLARLGPELLDPAIDEEAVARRLAEPRFARRCLTGLLQDQSVVAGVGNYLCCEVLFDCGFHPSSRLAGLPAGSTQRLARSALRLIRQSYRTGGITNDLARAEALERRGASFEERRFMVYRRSGLPCYRCGTPIEKGRHCGRMGYLCPLCQPPP